MRTESSSKELEIVREADPSSGRGKGSRFPFLLIVGALYIFSVWAVLFVTVPELGYRLDGTTMAKENRKPVEVGAMETDRSTERSERAIKEELNRILKEAREKQKRIEEREKTLAEREFRLKVLQKTLMRKLGGDMSVYELESDLENTKGAGQASKVRRKTRREEQLEKVVKSYQAMKPENAASALGELFKKNSEAAIRIFTAMDLSRAAKIWDVMASEDPKLAAEISEELLK